MATERIAFQSRKTTARELGIGIVPFSPLGRGFFSGKFSEEIDEKDNRQVMFPRFQQDNMEKNKVLYDRVAALAKTHGCTPGQLALAWLLHQGDDVAPIPGTTKIVNLDQNVGSVDVKLKPKEVEEVADAVPKDEVPGDRFHAGLAKFSWKFAVTPPLATWIPLTNLPEPPPINISTSFSDNTKAAISSKL